MKKINRSIACFILFGLVLFGLGIFEVLDRRGDNDRDKHIHQLEIRIDELEKDKQELRNVIDKMNGLLDKN